MKALIAILSLTTVEAPVLYDLLDPANKAVSPRPTVLSDCLARAKAISGTCLTRQRFVTTSTCADEKAPTVALVQKEVDGQKYWEIPTGTPEPPVPSDANGWKVMVWVYIHNPAWPAGYPNCWVRGWAQEDTWRLNPNYPNTPIMELITANMADTSEPPNSIEPVEWPGDTPG